MGRRKSGVQYYEYTPKVNLTESQKLIDASKARFKIIKAGRRFGKTKFAVRWQIIKALEVANEDHYFVAPTYRMAAEIAWKEFVNQLDKELIEKINERSLEITLVNGSRICLKGSENEDSLRGRRLGSLVMDEAAFHKPNVWNEILRPMLADLRAPALFISSPRRGWFTSLFQYAAAKTDPDFVAWHFTIYDNPHISREEIDQIKATTSDMTFRKEYMAEEVEQEGAVYLEFNRGKNISHPEKFAGFPTYPTVVGIDWGHDDDTGVAWLSIAPSGKIFMGKEHLRNGWDVRRHAEVIQTLSNGMNIRRDGYVLDISAFRKEATSGSSIAESFAKEMGFSFQKSYKTGLDYGIDLVKRFLRGDGQEPWLYISPSCKETIAALEAWEFGSHEPDILAALRYALTHAVMRKLTNLHEQLPRLKVDTNFLTEPKDLLLVKRSRGGQWAWDNDFGAPIG